MNNFNAEKNKEKKQRHVLVESDDFCDAVFNDGIDSPQPFDDSEMFDVSPE